MKIYRYSMASAEIYYHGTQNEFPFEAIRPSPNDVGIHFGNFRQAKWRVEHQNRVDRHTDYSQKVPPGSKIFEVYLDVNNPLEMPDLGNWNQPDMVAEELYKMGEFTLEEAKSVRTGQDIARILKESGYDSIAYENYIEGTVGGFRREPSGWSIIVFSPSQIKSYRVHSVWGNPDEYGYTQPKKTKDKFVDFGKPVT